MIFFFVHGGVPITTAVAGIRVELEMPTLVGGGMGPMLLFGSSGASFLDWVDVTADVRRADMIAIDRGIRGSGPTDRVALPSQAGFTLNNSASNSAGLLGYYSLYHANKRAGFGIGIRCRIKIQDPATGLWHVRFIGKVDAVRPVANQHGIRATYLVAKSWLDEASRWMLTADVPEQIGKRWEEIAVSAMSFMSTAPEAMDFDEGGNPFPYALDTSGVNQQSMLAEFGKLARSEAGMIFEKADGTLKGEGRHTRLANTTVVWTLSDADIQDLAVPSTRDEIINSVLVTTHPKVVDPLPTTVVYSQANVIALEPGVEKLLMGPYRDPVTGDQMGATEIQHQIPGTDYLANAQEDGLGADVTTDVTITVVLGAGGAQMTALNGGAARAYLLTNRLIGRGIRDHGQQQFPAKDESSIAAHGENVVNLDMPYQDSEDVGKGFAEYTLAKYKDPFAQARSVKVIARDMGKLSQVVNREISDRIAISEVVTGLNSEYFINGERLVVRPDGYVEVVYTLAPATDPLAGLYWILGTSVLGVDTIPAPF